MIDSGKSSWLFKSEKIQVFFYDTYFFVISWAIVTDVTNILWSVGDSTTNMTNGSFFLYGKNIFSEFSQVIFICSQHKKSKLCRSIFSISSEHWYIFDESFESLWHVKKLWVNISGIVVRKKEKSKKQYKKIFFSIREKKIWEVSNCLVIVYVLRIVFDDKIVWIICLLHTFWHIIRYYRICTI